MGKKHRVNVPDFSSHKKQGNKGPVVPTVAPPPVAPKAPAIKPQATSSKSGRRGS